MAKRGYTCQCGWHLDRGNLTREQYAEKKRFHANISRQSPRKVEVVKMEGIVTPLGGCQFLREELKQSQKVGQHA